MSRFKRIGYGLWGVVVTLSLAPVTTRAHEVYVLSPDEIATGINTPPFDMLTTLYANLGSFVFWGFIVFVVVSTIFFMSICFLSTEMSRPIAANVFRLPVVGVSKHQLSIPTKGCLKIQNFLLPRPRQLLVGGVMFSARYPDTSRYTQ